MDDERVPEASHGNGGIPGVPTWVKVLGISLAALVVLVLIVMVINGGQHGPGRHM